MRPFDTLLTTPFERGKPGLAPARRPAQNGAHFSWEVVMKQLFTFFFCALWASMAAWAGESAAAGEKFDLQGLYGVNSGCAMARGTDPVDDRASYISSEGYGGYEWHCKFVWSHKEAGSKIGAYEGSTVWSAITMCAGEGEAFTELLTIQLYENNVTVSNGKNDPVVMKRCK